MDLACRFLHVRYTCSSSSSVQHGYKRRMLPRRSLSAALKSLRPTADGHECRKRGRLPTDFLLSAFETNATPVRCIQNHRRHPYNAPRQCSSRTGMPRKCKDAKLTPSTAHPYFLLFCCFFPSVQIVSTPPSPSQYHTHRTHQQPCASSSAPPCPSPSAPGYAPTGPPPSHCTSAIPGSCSAGP